MKDQFGQETQVGDVVVFSSMNTTGLHEAVVLRIGPNQIRTSYGSKAAGNFVVVTQQLQATGNGHRVDQLRKANSDKMDFSVEKPKAPSTKWKYLIARKGAFITVGKIACNNQGDQYKNTDQFMKNGVDECIERTSNWNGRSYVTGFKLVDRVNGYYCDAHFKLSEIKELGLLNAIEKEITMTEFCQAVDSGSSSNHVALKASGIWRTP